LRFLHLTVWGGDRSLPVSLDGGRMDGYRWHWQRREISGLIRSLV